MVIFLQTVKRTIRKSYQYPFLIFILAATLSGCKVYKQNIILKSETDIQSENFESEIAKIEEAYQIKAGDKLNIEVYTNKGERIIDPNMELNAMAGGGIAGGGRLMPDKEFEVLPDGNAILPGLGELKVEGYSIAGLQDYLKEAYEALYIDPFVRIRALNRRVVVLGGMGGQVIPLNNERMNLLEVLALAGGLNRESIGRNIRLIRGPLDNPSVQVIDLSTIDGMQKASLDIIPNDIIYVEPQRRIFTESLRDLAPVIGIVTNVVTLFIVVQSLNNNDDPTTP